jgi:hypothetical protein
MLRGARRLGFRFTLRMAAYHLIYKEIKRMLTQNIHGPFEMRRGAEIKALESRTVSLSRRSLVHQQRDPRPHDRRYVASTGFVTGRGQIAHSQVRRGPFVV